MGGGGVCAKGSRGRNQRPLKGWAGDGATSLCNFGGCGVVDHKTRFAVRMSKSCGTGGSVGLPTSSRPKARIVRGEELALL